MTEQDFIKEIWKLDLGDVESSKDIYMRFCSFLKEKYGLVDKDYDEKPTTRGKEWIEIHHIMEYELDDIANRTRLAQDLHRLQIKNDPKIVIVIVKKEDIDNEEERYNIYKANKRKHKETRFFLEGPSLEDLKPYNKKEMLVYANKIEHFLLHYLIDSIRGKDFLSGGPNYLWDGSVALDLYGFYKSDLIELKKNKDRFYSLMSSEEITKLYKKLIDWKQWNIEDLKPFWYNFAYIIEKIRFSGVCNISDKEKFYYLMNMLGVKIDSDLKESIDTLPYLGKIVQTFLGKFYRVNDIDYTLDGKVVCHFLTGEKKTYTVSNEIIEIGKNAFGPYLEKITIPLTVEKMDDKAFERAENLKEIHYLGTRALWDERFGSINISNFKLVCKK